MVTIQTSPQKPNIWFATLLQYSDSALQLQISNGNFVPAYAVRRGPEWGGGEGSEIIKIEIIMAII